MENATEIKKLVKEGKMIIGKEKTLKSLIKGELSEILIASNAEELSMKSFEKYSNLSGVIFTSLDVKNDELGVICQKPFSISVLGKLK